MLSALHKSGARMAARSASRVVSRGFAKDIKFGVDGRNAMLVGVNTLADDVQVRIELCLTVLRRIHVGFGYLNQRM